MDYGYFRKDIKMTTSTQALQKVDHAALKANQLTIIALNILAFVFNLPILAALVAVVMGLGSLLKVPGFLPLYRYLYKPLGLLKPDVLNDNPEPHRLCPVPWPRVHDRWCCFDLSGRIHSGMVPGLAGDHSGSSECLRRILRGLRCLLLAGSFAGAWLCQDAACGQLPWHEAESERVACL
jgi:hypothetical protein